MKFQGAVIREQGRTFAVVVVKHHVLQNRFEADRTIRGMAPIFSGVPIILVAQDVRGRPTWFGRSDIVAFMSRVPMHAISWRGYSLG